MAPGEAVGDGDGFVAVILDVLGDVDDRHGHVEVRDTAVAHGGVVAEERSLLDPSHASAHHSKCHRDDRTLKSSNIPIVTVSVAIFLDNPPTK